MANQWNTLGDKALGVTGLTGILDRAHGGTEVDGTTIGQNLVFSGPASGGSGNASFRSIVVADLPNLAETVQDIVGAFILAGTNVSVVYNDAANTFTISADTQSINTQRLMGRYTAGLGHFEEILLGVGLYLSGSGLYVSTLPTGTIPALQTTIDDEIYSFFNSPYMSQLRISLSNTDPNPAVGGTGTALYVMPFEGEFVSVYDTTDAKWKGRKISGPITVDLTTFGSKIPFLPQDVFIYWDVPTLSLKSYARAWTYGGITKTITATTNTTTPVITVGASHGYVVDDVVCIQGISTGATALNNRLFRVTATAATTITISDLDTAAITAPGGTGTDGTVYKILHNTTRTTALVDVGAVPTESGSAVKAKYIGTVAYSEVLNTIEDTLLRPFVYNRYNKRSKPIANVPTAASPSLTWLCGTTADTPTLPRAAGKRYQDRQWFLNGMDNDYVQVELDYMFTNPNTVSGAYGYHCFLSLDSAAAANWTINNNSWSLKSAYKYMTLASVGATSIDNYYQFPRDEYDRQVAAGLHYLQPMEFAFNSAAVQFSVYKAVLSVASFTFLGGTTGQYDR